MGSNSVLTAASDLAPAGNRVSPVAGKPSNAGAVSDLSAMLRSIGACGNGRIREERDESVTGEISGWEVGSRATWDER